VHKIKKRKSKMNEGEGRYEEFKVDGDRLIAKIKEIVHQGNVRRIIIKDEKGATLIEVPLTIGVVGVILLPVWAALGAIAALAANFTIVVERIDSSKDKPVDKS
jgi:Flp pilus assembly pilin Flp